MSSRLSRSFWLTAMLMLFAAASGSKAVGLADEPAAPVAPSAQDSDLAQDPGLAPDSDLTQNSGLAQDSDLAQCLTDLASPVFADRQKAIESLKTASPAQIQGMSEAIENHADNEVVRRLIEILELRYDQTALKSLAASAASDALEKAAESQRWFVAEAARDVLKRHWQRRVELAVIGLVRMNVSLSPTDPTILWKPDPSQDQGPFGMRDPTSTQHLKIFVDRNWPVDPRAFELLKRLEPLRGEAFLTQPTMVSFYLIDGHPLSIEQAAILKGLFGDTRIAERGRVCLGVLNDSRFGEDHGVVVSSVQEKSSAADAGIRPGDLILGMNSEKLSDFEDLVTRLRKYDVGDKIILQIRGNRLPGENPLNNVEVTLKGWQ